jgi:drug/metabolite transporter (DMT)-like permease
MTMNSQSLTTRTAGLIVVMVLLNSLGNLLLSVGMKHVGGMGSASDAVAITLQVATSGPVWLGIAALLLFMTAHMLLLSWTDYSFVQPASAGGYVLTPLLGALFAGEHVGPVRWAGVLLICCGVGLVGRTPPRTTAVR